jgi:uncharacterized protein involved in response to NO
MVFGYAVAVVAGFLLTAVGNWTERETLVGWKLLALAALWLLGRIVMSIPGLLPAGAAALVDLAFLPALGVVLARPLIAARNRRNFVMVGVLAALAAANAAVHLDALGLAAVGSGRRASTVAIDILVFLSLVIAGRVVPMFTSNATGKPAVRAPTVVEALTLASMFALVAFDVTAPDSTGARAVAGVVAAVALLRAARWGTRHTGKHPLLWILHAGYGWIIVGLVLRALPLLRLEIPPSAATHAFTVGAIGSLTVGMMARVALGHTGRRLEPSPAMTAAFALISLAAIVRVFGPLIAPAAYSSTLLVAGLAWAVAFALYLFVYTPILFAPRVDGKPG